MKKIPIEVRIEKYIDRSQSICWLWKGATNSGYGIIGDDNGKIILVRRFLYEKNTKLIPKKQCLRSICKNRLCVNPDHHIISEDQILTMFNKNPITNCWEWQGSFSNKGYGIFQISYKMKLAHRIMYERYKGHIPEKMHICHSCDNPKCVNPEHLFMGTVKDNMHDMIKKGRDNKSKGSKHVRAKIDEYQARQIKIKIRDGLAIKDICKLFNFPYIIVWQIYHNKSWKYIQI